MAVHTASGGDALEINLKCGTLVVPGLWQYVWQLMFAVGRCCIDIVCTRFMWK